MATSPFVYGIVSQVLQELKDEQTPTQTKSNTYVSTVGLVITVVTTIVMYLLESGFDWVPLWLPQVVPILGFLGTVFGVSKTRNYVTDSTIRNAELKISQKIGDLVDDSVPDSIANEQTVVVDPLEIVKPEPTTQTVDESSQDLAEYFDTLAKDIANRG